MASMYGAKALQIAKVAFDTWAPGRTPTDKARAAVETAVFAVVQDPAATVATLGAISNFPAPLKHGEFIALARSLADNPLAA